MHCRPNQRHALKHWGIRQRHWDTKSIWIRQHRAPALVSAVSRCRELLRPKIRRPRKFCHLSLAALSIGFRLSLSVDLNFCRNIWIFVTKIRINGFAHRFKMGTAQFVFYRSSIVALPVERHAHFHRQSKHYHRKYTRSLLSLCDLHIVRT